MVNLSISYRLKDDKNSIEYVYNNTWDWNFIEKIVIPTVSSTVSNVYSQYTLMDIVNLFLYKYLILFKKSINKEIIYLYYK